MDTPAKGQIDRAILDKAADLIRRNTAENVQLTPLNVFRSEPFSLEGEALESLPSRLKSIDDYADIKVISTVEGKSRYLYSGRHMSDSFARCLMRKKLNDPCFLIADTVREESRVYPRPTCSAMFELPPFNLDLDRLDEYLKGIRDNEAYRDIHWFEASTGVIYLYSDQYIVEDFARMSAEWTEVEQFQNQ